MSALAKKLPWIFVAVLLIGGGLLLLSTAMRGTAPSYNATVNGTVTIDGSLATSGTVTFNPATGGQPATGNIHSDGTYSLRSGQGNLANVDGGTVASGAYVVTVSINAPPVNSEKVAEGGPPVPGPSLIAERYRSVKTSDLKEVVEPGLNVIVLNLESATEPEPEASQVDQNLPAEEEENAVDYDGEVKQADSVDDEQSSAVQEEL